MEPDHGVTFTQVRNGYAPADVDAYIDHLAAENASLGEEFRAAEERCAEALAEVERLRSQLRSSESGLQTTAKEVQVLRAQVDAVKTLEQRLTESAKEVETLQHQIDTTGALKQQLMESRGEVDALKEQVAELLETSQSPHAMSHRIAKMLQAAVDETAEMRAEAQANADALIAAAEDEAAESRKKQAAMLAGMADQQAGLDAECANARIELEVELTEKRKVAESDIEAAQRHAEQERDKLLRDAKESSDRYFDKARRLTLDTNQHRISILEQMMSIYRGLESIPATLNDAYHDKALLVNASVNNSEPKVLEAPPIGETPDPDQRNWPPE